MTLSSINYKELAKQFPVEDIEWRIGRAGENNGKVWATALAYVTNRAIMNRLDEVCGAQNWRNEYAQAPSGGVLCGLSIYDVEKSQWITKWDGAENTDIEAVKGGLSDAMKRAGVQWGIGRYLYNLTEGWATIAQDGDKKALRGSYKDPSDPSGKKHKSFRWYPPALPDWAIPQNKIATKSIEKPPYDDTASEEELLQIKTLCEDTKTEQVKLYRYFQVTDKPTKEQAQKMIASLKAKLSKQLDSISLSQS